MLHDIPSDSCMCYIGVHLPCIHILLGVVATEAEKLVGHNKSRNASAKKSLPVLRYYGVLIVLGMLV